MLEPLLQAQLSPGRAHELSVINVLKFLLDELIVHLDELSFLLDEFEAFLKGHDWETAMLLEDV